MKKNNLLKIVALCCILLSGFSTFAQDAHLSKMVDQMFEATSNKDYDVMLDTTHPMLFEMMSRSELKKVLQSTFEGNDEFTVEMFKKAPIYTLSEIFIDEDKKAEYAFVVYDLPMTMIFHKEEFDEEGQAMMSAAFEQQNMEAEFVSANTINLIQRNAMNILIKDESTDNKWVIINYDQNLKMMFGHILPASVFEKAETYLQNFTTK